MGGVKRGRVGRRRSSSSPYPSASSMRSSARRMCDFPVLIRSMRHLGYFRIRRPLVQKSRLNLGRVLRFLLGIRLPRIKSIRQSGENQWR
jgi:hypothetical protein